MATRKTFGETIREMRKAKAPPVTQRDLAGRVAARLREEDRRGFDFTYLSKIENDRLPPPSVPAILALAKELNADADELLALAGKAPVGLGDALKQSGAARTFFRSAVNHDLTEEEWKQLLDALKRIKEGNSE